MEERRIAQFHADFGVVNVVHDSTVPAYTGDYEVTPKDEEQILATKEKRMTDNVTVKEIPYAEMDNDAGGKTIIIAS